MNVGFSPVAAVLIGYAIGSVPFSFLVARAFGVDDVRKEGSGNVGATNVMRTAGRLPGLLALILDGAKGAAVVWLTERAGQGIEFACWAGFAAVVGHLFPVWLGFRGGKGVATGAGLFVPLAPNALLVGIAVFIATLALSRFVSLGSILASLSLALSVWTLGEPRPVVILAWLSAALVILKHHGNVERLMKGEEPRLGKRT